ncbi:MAG: SH3 domain-containing protein [Alphaproteobacteria bacterium]|nr:SH3 domain-containing protein [Alphaproteobacteria bacterium]MBP7760043.1 SH3 domain-containing protein [Alphaproteobacteria bacterium]MBP7763405.1 SH3 domain-containing protein [Alphaproteobacteria bacterium]MBP7905748.1 SH3 domain-containing protein [Alphaproteobacteria bacterium]
MIQSEMKKYYLFVLLVFVSTISADVVFACGSVEKNFGVYVQNKSKSKVEVFLKSQSCGSDETYSPLYAEPVIARVLANAIDLGVSRESIEGVFKKYNCLSLARNQDVYKKITDFVGKEKLTRYCDPAKFRKMFIVISEGGANLRSKPTMQAKIIGTVAESVLVTNGTVYGDWVLVDTYSGTGYMHASTLMPYITND